MGFVGEDVPYAAVGARMVALVARNQVQVNVKDALSTGGGDVDADVVAVGLELLGDRIAFRDQQLATGRVLLRLQLEEIGAMAKRNDQRMPSTDRIAVARTVGVLVLSRDPVRGAEQTRVLEVNHGVTGADDDLPAACSIAANR